MTNAQRAILNAVVQPGRHLTADEVYWIVKQQFPSIALGTIYRNLNQFADAGLIRRVARVGSADYFEGNTLAHGHTLCMRCGGMADVQIPQLRGFLQEQVRGDIRSFDLIIHHICPQCMQHEDGKPDGEDDDTAQRKEKTD